MIVECITQHATGPPLYQVSWLTVATSPFVAARFFNFNGIISQRCEQSAYRRDSQSRSWL